MPRLFSSVIRRLAALTAHRGGGLAPIAALTAVAMVMAAGSAVDIGRAARIHSLLQDVADSAALAGASQADPVSAVASASAYVNAALGSMSDKPTLQASYKAASAADYASPPDGGLPFTVTLSGTMPTSIMAMVVKTLPVAVSATAQANIGKKVTFTLTNYSSDAADHNVIYGYGYDPTAYSVSKGTLYPYAAPLDPKNLLLDNKQSYPSGYTKSFWIALNDTVGLALSNTTGTSQNCYGLVNGVTTVYYSHRLDVTGQYHDYPTSNFNWCGFSTITNNSDTTQTIDDYKPVIPGQNYDNECYTCLVKTTTTTTNQPSCTPFYANWCYVNGRLVQVTYTPVTTTTTSGPVNQWNTPLTGDGAHGYVYAFNGSRNPLKVSALSQDCTAAAGVSYNWDDNGGGSDVGYTEASGQGPGDDDDHNDMVFTVTCTKAVKPGGARLTG